MSQSPPFAVIAEGFVSRRPETGPTANAASARCVWPDRLAAVRPTADDFGIEWNHILWRAATPVAGTSGHADWTNFAFGEPSVMLLADGSLLAVWWCAGDNGRGIRYCKLRWRGGGDE